MVETGGLYAKTRCAAPGFRALAARRRLRCARFSSKGSRVPALRVAALELPHRYGAPAAMLGLVDRALASMRAEADLVLLAECALTGYVSPRGDFDLTAFAEPLDGPSAQGLARLARAHGVSLAGPLVERDGARCFNALCLYDPSGERVGHWRKRHPWYPERWAAPGDLGTPVVAHRGLRVTACVCFDVHFIADDAPDALRAADVVLFPSAWVDEPPDDARDALLPDLARRFGVAVVNANWGFGAPAVPGQGRSRIVGPDGAQTVAKRRGASTFALADVVPRDLRAG